MNRAMCMYIFYSCFTSRYNAFHTEMKYTFIILSVSHIITTICITPSFVYVRHTFIISFFGGFITTEYVTYYSIMKLTLMSYIGCTIVTSRFYTYFTTPVKGACTLVFSRNIITSRFNTQRFIMNLT